MLCTIRFWPFKTRKTPRAVIGGTLWTKTAQDEKKGIEQIRRKTAQAQKIIYTRLYTSYTQDFCGRHTPCTINHAQGVCTSTKVKNGSRSGGGRRRRRRRGKEPRKTGNQRIAGGAQSCADGGRKQFKKSKTQSRAPTAQNQITAERNQRAQARGKRAKRAGS